MRDIAKPNWGVRPLGEVLQVLNGYAFKSKQFSETEGTPLIRIRDLKAGLGTVVNFVGDYDPQYVVGDGDLLIGMDGEFRCHEWQGGKALLNQRVCKLTDFSDELLPRFLYYGINKYLKEIEDRTAYTTVKHLSSKTIKSIDFPLPPLEEQQRIVAVLDEAFEGLARARAHARANLQNARELFESLRFVMLSEQKECWETHLLADCFRLKSGENLTAKTMVPGPFPVYGGNGIAGSHDARNLSGDNVIIGRVGAFCGNARYIDHDIWLTDNAFKVVNYNFDFDHRFLAYLLNFKNLRSFARQAAQPVISNSSLADLKLTFPASIELQAEVANKLSDAETELEDIKKKYETKIQDLDDLRQSLLQKAFAGELT